MPSANANRDGRTEPAIAADTAGPSPAPAAPAKLPAWGRGQRGEAGIWRILCLCEIGNFATLRRHLGRPRADALVQDVATQIIDLCPDIRIVTAGRALIEIAFERDSPEAGAADIDRLRTAFLKPLDLDGEPYTLHLHFGIAASPSDDSDEVRLTEAAESALEQARGQGKAVMLDLSRADLAFDKLTLMRELPRAIAKGEMFLQYQPKVHVRRQEIASAEALIRWQHPQRGLILPGDFISVAEEAGEIGALTIWTLRQVIADQKRLAADGYDLTLFLNISGMLLADAHFVAEACEIVTSSGAKLGFEITETAVIRDPDSAIRHLQTFADIGVQLAIDDYGAGLSSLAYLKQLPARELKIDKMFVLQLTSSNRDPLIVRSTIDLAHALEMEVTAEGVETPSALALLSVMGCDMVQGYLISRPLGFDAFRNFLAEDAARATSGESPSSFIRPESFWKRA
ncbi:putative bifunctional diguanylate cyclase/phosphodiesterase [Sphingomonas sp. M1-B02]|uniref:putative bifunctional diguanylate cyclase/phosphodiesterase n=1 Tax=Sphingomonas sp. M1-B02 TaxID=3114300 RepID=UPI00223F6240|nr:GGDEF domain-containing phosphodiesterase [Sphingomonas sp. S6-11]UZK66233.1 GGDEF domain-containing phosphodiesterase [Sphingomonas sp. S6-11]